MWYEFEGCCFSVVSCYVAVDREKCETNIWEPKRTKSRKPSQTTEQTNWHAWINWWSLHTIQGKNIRLTLCSGKPFLPLLKKKKNVLLQPQTKCNIVYRVKKITTSYIEWLKVFRQGVQKYYQRNKKKQKKFRETKHMGFYRNIIKSQLRFWMDLI